MINKVKLAYSALGTIQIQLIYFEISEIKALIGPCGDPVVAYLFILYGEVLVFVMRKEKNAIKDINIICENV